MYFWQVTVSGVKVRDGYARTRDVAPALTRLIGHVLFAPENEGTAALIYSPVMLSAAIYLLA